MDDFIKALQNPSLYPHETSQFEVMETHISWVILTGLFAYKIKKPVDFGFIDYTTLEKRKHYIELELTLNQQLAHSLYESVITITGQKDMPELEGKGPVIEYALKMHQFDQSRLLSNVHKEEGLSKAITRSLASQIASFHQQAQVCEMNSPYGSLDHVFQPMLDNFIYLKQSQSAQPWQKDIQAIYEWTLEQIEHLKHIIQERKTQGFIRASHGDLRLSNIVLYHGKPIIFDCIEFNEDLRQIDVIADMAFLVMDLEHKNQKDLAHDFANHYFELTGDYQGLVLLNLYKTYRAMVWAKISALQLDTLQDDKTNEDDLKSDLENYVNLALSYQISAKPTLTITFGPSGCGKSHYTDQQLIKTKSFRLRSDVIRKQMFGIDLNTPTPPEAEDKLYSKETTQKVYQKLCDEAHRLLKHGISVIIDATFLKSWQRELFLSLSHEHEIPLKILNFKYETTQLRERLKQRASTHQVSDADEDVLEKQLATIEPLNDIERTYSEVI